MQLSNVNDLDLIQRQNNRLLQLEKEILESVALGEESQLILDALCVATEEIVLECRASIMLFDELNTALFVRSAPNLNSTIKQKLNGLKPGKEAGSCGTAVFLDKPVYVANTASDPRWGSFRLFAQDFNICACWSHPIKAKDGEIIGSFALSSFKSRPPTPFQKRLLSVAVNIAGIVLQREKQEQELWDLAHRDIITGIPNRILLDLRLEQAIACSDRQTTKHALFFIDLDNFKKINDIHGHKTGDNVLIEAAARIGSCIHGNDTLSRYGGDEFVLFVENISLTYNTDTLAEKIIATLSRPMFFNDIKLTVTPSIGISVFPDDGDNAEALLNSADTAMYHAKANGRNNYVCYKPELSQLVQSRLKIENQLKLAIQNNEFELYYQPQYINSGDNNISVEALLRWNHPELGMLLPKSFISIAEQSGIIKELGQFVILKACEQGKQWLDAGIGLGRIAVNISAIQICTGCFKNIQNTLKKTGLPARHLEIEITESLMVQQCPEVLTELHLMQDAGISIALDDFGTGYSSLSQLQCLPINKLKIDRSFVTNIPGNLNDEIITRTIISMGRNLGLNVIAEGVETQAQASFLMAEGCDAFQGFHFSRPLAVNDLESKIMSSSLLSNI